MEREQFIELPGVTDQRGSLSFIQAGDHIPFPIMSICWKYGSQHSDSDIHKAQDKIIVALSGKFTILLDNGNDERSYILNNPSQGLYIPALVSCRFEGFSPDSVYLVISSVSSPAGLSGETENNHLKTFSVEDCTVVKLPLAQNRAEDISFSINRIFYIYNIPPGQTRGMHAHKYCHEVLVATNGSFRVELDDGTTKKNVVLDRPDYGLYIPPGIWATETEYSSGAVCLVLASDVYDAENYIHTYSEFKKYRQHEN
jgi:uncharacterized RmlC-like cupin family protein